jgi:hypothetical protein
LISESTILPPAAVSARFIALRISVRQLDTVTVKAVYVTTVPTATAA